MSPAKPSISSPMRGVRVLVILDMAEEIKKYFDRHYQGGWHCIVGRNFGIFVTHEEGSFIRLTKGQLQVLLYRCLG